MKLEPMTAERLSPWIEETTQEYVASRMAAGESRAVAEENAAQSNERNFPDGRPLDTHRIFDLVADEQQVGFLWIGPSSVDPKSWWIFDIEIREEFRRRGYARAAIELGHAVAAELGATSIGLNVFGYNTGAQKLYSMLGYDTTAMQMKRQLP